MTTPNTPARTTDHLNELVHWSERMSGGTLLPRQYQRQPANLMFAAEYADALGISRIHVLTSIAIINGRPTPSADLMSAMVRAHGHKLRVTGDDTHAEAVLIRADDPDFEFRATWDETKARKAHLWGNKGPWTQYPAAMLRARAISEVVRMGASDVMAGGIYTPEELGADVDEAGNVVHHTATRQPQSQAQRADGGESAGQRIMHQIADTPQDNTPVDEWVDRIAAAGSVPELEELYRTASTNPAWKDHIRSMFTTRKQQINEANQQLQQQAEQREPAGEDTTGDDEKGDAPIDAELVD